MELTLETVVHVPAFDTRPAWTGTLEEAFFPWRREVDTPEFNRACVVMRENGFDEVREDFDEGLATLTVGDLVYIFDNPHVRVVEP